MTCYVGGVISWHHPWVLTFLLCLTWYGFCLLLVYWGCVFLDIFIFHFGLDTSCLELVFARIYFWNINGYIDFMNLDVDVRKFYYFLVFYFEFF